MKHIKRLLIVLGIIIGLFFIIAAFLPSSLHVEESLMIKAPSSVIFKNVNSLKAWETWSPFQKEDTAMTSEYSGPENGVGAVQTWKSSELGNGSMKIIESVADKYIKMDLDFMIDQKVVSDWKFEEDSYGTTVTWSVDICNLGYPFGRYIGMFIPRMMHRSFRMGLESLGNLSENQAKELQSYKTSERVIEEVPAWQALVIRDSSTVDKIGDVLASIYTEISKYMEENKIECVGPPYALYTLWDEKANKFVVEAGFPVKTVVKGSGRIGFKTYNACKAVVASHFGAYETTYHTYEAIEKYIEEQSLKQKGAPWEVYVSDPEKEKDLTKIETRIYYPVE